MSLMDASEEEWRPFLTVEKIMPRHQEPARRNGIPLPPTRTEQAFLLWQTLQQIGQLQHLKNVLETELAKVQETQVAHGPEFDLVIKGKDVTQAFHAEGPPKIMNAEEYARNRVPKPAPPPIDLETYQRRVQFAMKEAEEAGNILFVRMREDDADLQVWSDRIYLTKREPVPESKPRFIPPPAVPEPVVNMRSNMSPDEWRAKMAGPINESRLPVEPERGPDGSAITLEQQAQWEAEQIAAGMPF